MKTRTIRQKVAFKVKSREVYEALMNSKKHAVFTGSKADISSGVGGKFSVFDGYATGKNLELVKDKTIIQTWRASDWEEGHYSTITFNFSSTKTGCSLSFIQEVVPASQYEAIKRGWRDFYWDPMKEMLEKSR